MGNKNIWGRGDALIVVDGVPRTDNFDVYLLEVESITVLKDPVSRALYGAMGDQGVIMVTTKRGKAYKKVFNVHTEYSVSQPIKNTYPKYMNAADYMQTINSFYAPTAPVYSEKKITETRNRINPAINPDLDLYSNEMLYPTTAYRNLFGEASGGNKAAQYYLNLGWQNNNGWLKSGNRENTNKLNLRANVDYQLSSNFKMSLDAVAMVEMKNSPNISDYWATASTVLPNAYPLYWDPAVITNPAKKEEILRTARLLPNGMLVGGNNTYQTTFYGDMLKKGQKVAYNRNLQINIGGELDLNKLLPGLKANAYLAIDAYNTLVKAQNAQYVVYNPLMFPSKLNPAVDSISVQPIGQDVKVSNFAPVDAEIYFHRRIGLYGNLTYNASFEKTDVSLLAVAYRNQLAIQASRQEQRNLTFGLNGNIIHDKKYVLDFSIGLLGTQKLTNENNLTLAPSVGLAWILSEEKFLADNKVIDYLKLRGSAGILKNDNWTDYWLQSESFGQGGNYTYNNGSSTNQERVINNFSNIISWQKRKELVLGFDASLLKNKLWIESSVFYTEQYDMIAEMNNYYPQLLGTNTKRYWGNNDADRIKGFDLGMNYNTNVTKDLSLKVGGNLIVKSEKILKKDEPNYINAYQYRVGTAGNSIWGMASNGLYGISDFEADGKLKSTLPVPAWGAVAPGDIKYIDWNADNLLNSDDEHVIGRSGADLQYSVFVNLKYKKFELHAIGIGYLGGNNNRTGNYYRPYGTNMKFPEHLKQAYSATNPDVNSLYPRLTVANSSHNFRNSEFWMYQNNSFSIPTIQLTYNYEGKSGNVIKSMSIYLRGTNLIRYNTRPEFANLSLTAPKVHSFTLGSILNF
jgi:TonB-linked SusC/RagA family outer membrane protein